MLFSQNAFSGLEPKVVLSQWYPTKGCYSGRDVEGMSLLLSIPSLEHQVYRLAPRKLVQGCEQTFVDLRTKIFHHYDIGDWQRTEWAEWFTAHIPTEWFGISRTAIDVDA